MEVIKTEIDGPVVLKPRVFGDARGYFFESYSKREFDAQVRPVDFVQDNQSCSTYGVVRGLHFQKGDHSQSKLVRVVKGKVLDVAVDIRKGSPTFGKHVAVELSEDNGLMLFVPKGFAHGFSVLSDIAVFQYKCDNYYCPESEGAVAWDDPDLGIDWKIPAGDVVLSEKDSKHPKLSEAPELFSIEDKLYK
ncbi:MAG: dTDP-4-dehydrorhamnose 3,5-epimerase [Muribaculaceae bacterium]|nr:dTDP-4-dehydrorhamnose 3,5-epimerase [Muribaculaceae bacterium]